MLEPLNPQLQTAPLARWPESLEALAELLLAEAWATQYHYYHSMCTMIVAIATLVIVSIMITFISIVNSLALVLPPPCNSWIICILCPYYDPLYRLLQGGLLCLICQIRAVSPSGPLFLAGHSFGATVCLEMARQAQAGRFCLVPSI